MVESYNWLLPIIDSCQHPFQLSCCHTLIDLFRRMYTNESEFGSYYDKLMEGMAVKDALLTV